ncbi:MAG: hypothetical protein ABIZ04_17825 [Opitutus sp.]
MVTATSSLTIPIDVWRARTQPSQGVIIKFPTTRGWYPTYYSGTDQYLISKGYDVIAFDFQPKLPGQPGWDLAITADDVTAALAVINYARITLGARPDKIVLSGESNGTLFVARTAARMECKLGGIVLQGVGGRMKDLNNVRNHKFSVALLQGEYDRLSPLEAKEAVEIIFGADIFKKPNGLWVGLKNEGHVPRLLLSRASIAAAAYSAIRAP